MQEWRNDSSCGKSGAGSSQNCWDSPAGVRVNPYCPILSSVTTLIHNGKVKSRHRHQITQRCYEKFKKVEVGLWV